MLIVDIGAHDGKDVSLPYAKAEGNLIYAIEPTPELARQLQTHQIPNLQVFCLTIGEDEDAANLLGEDGPIDTSAVWSVDADNSANLKPIKVLITRLDAFIRQNHIAEIDLLRVSARSDGFQVIKSAGNLICNIKKIRLEISPSALHGNRTYTEEVVSYLEASGFRLVSQQLDSNGLEEHLNFIRVYRYARNQSELEVFEVDVPHIGLIETPKDDLVGRLLEQGIFEGPEQAFLWLYLRSGDTFFDCGAHVGIFSCIAAKKLQNQGQIIGFEPIDNNVALYSRNLQRLNSQCFTVMKVGLSNQLGEAPLFLGKSGLSAYSTFVSGARDHKQIGDDRIMVEQTTLNQVVKDFSISSVTLAKLDVEGWEIPVLLGAAESIKKTKFPLWMIEFTEENAVAAGSSTDELGKLIKSLGYTLCRFDATQFRLVPEINRSTYGYENLFAAMDIDMVNERLESASLADQTIARDIVSRWDLASRAEEARILSDAYQKLSQSLEICEVDRADRLEQIHTLTRWLKESERTGQESRIGQELEETRQELERTRQELEETRQELERTRQELERTVHKLEQTGQELERTHQELEQTSQELERTSQELARTCQELEWTRQELEQTRQELEFIRSEPLWRKVIKRFRHLITRKND